MSYQLPNGAWVGASGGYSQSANGAWSNRSGRIPSNIGIGSSAYIGGTGMLVNGRPYERPPPMRPSLPWSPNCNPRPFNPYGRDRW
jgi:hypothetical protein